MVKSLVPTGLKDEDVLSVASCEVSAVACSTGSQSIFVAAHLLTHLVTVAVTNGPIFVKSVMDTTLNVHDMNDNSWPPDILYWKDINSF